MSEPCQVCLALFREFGAKVLEVYCSVCDTVEEWLEKERCHFCEGQGGGVYTNKCPECGLKEAE